MLRAMRSVGASIFASLTVFGAFGAASAAYINPATNQIEAEGRGDILVRFDFFSAAYSSDVVSVDYGGGVLFNNQTDPIGTTVNIGSFAAGEEVNFQINVLNTGLSYVTGLGSDNFDGVVHALLDLEPSGAIRVAFEDLLNGGDLDYNDVVFTVYETPIPAAGLLLLSGLAGLGFAARGRKKAKA